ncbi:hypothetical protein H0H92_010659, partial [Tricholoma furcatifolium]
WRAAHIKSDPTGHSWTLKSLWQSKGNDVYLGFSSQSQGSPVLGVSQSQTWYIKQINGVGGAQYQRVFISLFI